jgi:hypothetical protein
MRVAMSRCEIILPIHAVHSCGSAIAAELNARTPSMSIPESIIAVSNGAMQMPCKSINFRAIYAHL